MASAAIHTSPRVSWRARSARSLARSIMGLPCPPSCCAPHAQVLRNHTVGRTWISAEAFERLVTVTRQRMSSGSALAYSTTTSA